MGKGPVGANFSPEEAKAMLADPAVQTLSWLDTRGFISLIKGKSCPFKLRVRPDATITKRKKGFKCRDVIQHVAECFEDPDTFIQVFGDMQKATQDEDGFSSWIVSEGAIRKGYAKRKREFDLPGASFRFFFQAGSDEVLCMVFFQGRYKTDKVDDGTPARKKGTKRNRESLQGSPAPPTDTASYTYTASSSSGSRSPATGSPSSSPSSAPSPPQYLGCNQQLAETSGQAALGWPHPQHPAQLRFDAHFDQLARRHPHPRYGAEHDIGPFAYSDEGLPRATQPPAKIRRIEPAPAPNAPYPCPYPHCPHCHAPQLPPPPPAHSLSLRGSPTIPEGANELHYYGATPYGPEGQGELDDLTYLPPLPECGSEGLLELGTDSLLDFPEVVLLL